MVELLTAVSSVGFPIVAWVLLFKHYREERKRAREERRKWMGAIKEHTEAIRSLRRSHDAPVRPDGGRED